jgi:hypothetical protein
LHYAALLVGLHPSLNNQRRRKDALVKGACRLHYHAMELRRVGEQLSDRLMPSDVKGSPERTIEDPRDPRAEQ